MLAFILAGVTIGIVPTAEHGTVAGAASEDIRGSAFGFLAAIESFGNLVASGVAGLLWTLVNPLAAFRFESAGMIIATVAGLTARRHSARPTSPPPRPNRTTRAGFIARPSRERVRWDDHQCEMTRNENGL